MHNRVPSIHHLSLPYSKKSMSIGISRLPTGSHQQHQKVSTVNSLCFQLIDGRLQTCHFPLISNILVTEKVSSLKTGVNEGYSQEDGTFLIELFKGLITDAQREMAVQNSVAGYILYKFGTNVVTRRKVTEESFVKYTRRSSLSHKLP